MSMTPHLFTRRLLLLAALALAPLAQAQDKAAARVILTVSSAGGKVSKDFDLAALERMPQVTFTTATPWYNQPTKFSGPLLRDVLAAADAKGARLQAIALNDYKVEMPVDEVIQHGAIVALRLNDRPMSVRDKGPLFVVFPFDSQPELRTERYYTRSIWQLRRLQVD